MSTVEILDPTAWERHVALSPSVNRELDTDEFRSFIKDKLAESCARREINPRGLMLAISQFIATHEGIELNRRPYVMVAQDERAVRVITKVYFANRAPLRRRPSLTVGCEVKLPNLELRWMTDPPIDETPPVVPGEDYDAEEFMQELGRL